MTYEQVKQDVARLLSATALEHDPFLMAQAEFAIRQANEEVARVLRTPAIIGQVTPDSNGVIAWPADAFPGRDGIGYVLYSDGEDTRRLPFLTLEEAYIRYPSWENRTGNPQFVIIDPNNKSYGIKVVPYDATSTTGTFRLRYIKIPGQMDSPNDMPLDGELPQYHHLVSLNAAIKLLEYDYTGGEVADYIGFTNIRKLELYQKQYQMKLLEALRSTQLSVLPIRNPFWSVE